MTEKFYVFASEFLASYLESNTAKVQAELAQMADRQVIDGDETGCRTSLTTRYTVKIPEVKFDAISAIVEQRPVPIDATSPAFYLGGRGTIRRNVVVYRLPFDGDGTIFRLRPQQYTVWTHQMWIEGSDPCFEVVPAMDDSSSANQQKDEILRHFQSQLHNAQQEIHAYNTTRLPKVIAHGYQERKQRALEKQRFIEGLDVPVQEEKEK
ncbi:MAG: hypothetical protein M1396_04595 [Chloroflexi bacterium]|nr:hypothetical protein [Chloroflexota bacterium]